MTIRLRFALLITICFVQSAIKRTRHHQQEPIDPNRPFFDCLRNCVSQDCPHSRKKLNLGIGFTDLCEKKCAGLVVTLSSGTPTLSTFSFKPFLPTKSLELKTSISSRALARRKSSRQKSVVFSSSSFGLADFYSIN